MKIDETALQKIFQRIEVREREFVELLKEAVAIPSVSAEPERREDCVAMVEWTKKALEQMGASVDLHKGGKQTLYDGRELAIPPIIFATLAVDKKKKTLLVYGHLDVQPAKKEDGWNTDPFTLTELDGKLYGRGATDDKGPVLAWLNAISTMQQLGIELPVNIKFVLECMEESGSEGLDHALTKHKDFLHDVDFSCISDNYFLGKEKPCLTYGLRGLTHYSVHIECAKQDLHSGTYGGSVPEAMDDLMAIMSQLKSVDGKILIPGLAELVAPLTLEEKKVYETIDFDIESYKKNDIGAHGLLHDTKENLLMSRFREPSLSIHGIEGAHSGFGQKTIIPSKVTGKFSIRLVPNMTPEAVSRCVIDYLKKLWKERGSPNKFEVISDTNASAKPWLGDYMDRNFQAGSRAIERVFGCKPDFTREGGSIPVTLTLQEQTKKSVMLLPIGACDDMAHSQNEKINRVNYIRGVKTLAAYILELADEAD